jgi:hypothetical protein
MHKIIHITTVCCILNVWSFLPVVSESSSSDFSQVSNDVPQRQTKPMLTTHRKKIKSLGLLEGRDEETIIIAPKRDAQAGEEKGAFIGRNRKKLKHRRINQFEVTKQQLEERDFMTANGKLDVEGLTTLMESELKREETNPDGSAPLMHHTLEDLDRMYPTPEGNVRLGLEEAQTNQPYLRNFSKSKRWERASHFVEFRKPGKLDELLPDEILNYKKDGGRMTIFVQGSIGYRYGIEVLEYDTIWQLKQKVWAEERHYRYEVENVKTQDEAEHFEIESQELVVNGTWLHPDSRTLKWYNITAYTILTLVPKGVEIELTEEDKNFTMDLLWWREWHR